MQSNKLNNHTAYRTCATLFRIGGALLITSMGNAVWAAENLLFTTSPELNQTQDSLARTVSSACSGRVFEGDFRTRCNNLVFTANDPLANNNNAEEVENALRVVSPEQIIGPSTQATKTTSGQTQLVGTTIQSRLQSLRTASNTAETTMMAGLTGGSAGIGDDARLSGWINANSHFGDADSTFQQLGFDFDSWGGTAGLDYRLSDNFLIGAAFSFLNSDINFDRSAGGVDSNTYTGSLYGTFYINDSFYVDAVASYGAADYDIDRLIRYQLTGNNEDNVNAKAMGSPDGSQYSFSIGSGYDYSKQNLTISPFLRANYLAVKIDGYSESGGAGWAAKFEEQNIQSLTTELGTAISYAFSIPSGVIVPQIKAKWIHEFKDNSRLIRASFLGDSDVGNATPDLDNQFFNTFTQSPDRNYFVVGADVSSTFSHGLSAFFAYNALLGYQNIDSHHFTLGGRLEF